MNQSINTDSKNSKEPQQKYRLGTVSIKILVGGGLKPVLQAPNLALSYYHGSKHTVVWSAWRFDEVKMGSLNVCSLKRRLEYPEFQKLVKSYGNLCVLESKLDDYDVTSLNGFSFLFTKQENHFFESQAEF